MGSIIYGCPGAEPTRPRFCRFLWQSWGCSSSLQQQQPGHLRPLRQLPLLQHIQPSCTCRMWPQQDSHHPLRGDRAALGLALLLIPLVYKLKLFVFSVIQCFLLGSSSCLALVSSAAGGGSGMAKIIWPQFWGGGVHKLMGCVFWKTGTLSLWALGSLLALLFCYKMDWKF